MASRSCAADWSTSSGARHEHAPRPGPVADDQRARPGSYGGRAGGRRTRPGQRQSRQHPARDVPRDHPARPAPRRDRRSRGGARRRSRPGQGQRGAACAGVNDDQAPELLRWALAEGYELRFIEQMPLDAQHGWSREGMVTADEIFMALEAEFVLKPASGAPGERAGGAVPGRRRRRHRRRDRLGHPSVLRRLRPGAADGRRPGAQLPLRPRGVRPARRPASGSDRRRDRRALGRRDASASVPVTASTTRRSCSPTVRCPRSAVDQHRFDGPDVARRDPVRRETAWPPTGFGTS